MKLALLLLFILAACAAPPPDDDRAPPRPTGVTIGGTTGAYYGHVR